MIEVSNEWKDIQQRFLLPESFVEINCAITDITAQESATVTGTNETPFSNAGSILDSETLVRYATNELNYWSLDGGCSILPNSAPYGATGYVSSIESTGSVTLSFPAVRTQPLSGITIVWDDKSKQYPVVFSVSAKNGNTVVFDTTVTNNTQRESEIPASFGNYDSITITIWNWSMPNRRPRIEKVILGQVLTLTKTEILGYTHEQYVDLLSGELPKNSIEFTLDNTDGRWNPTNPNGMERYLSERQVLNVRYGLDINGYTEWIQAGKFYLSEWEAPSNGLEARFVARDIFEYLMNEKYEGTRRGSYGALIISAFNSAGVPADFEYELDPELFASDIALEEGKEYVCSEIVQLCANAGNCTIHQDRWGKLHITKLTKPSVGFEFQYVIPSSLSYSHPEIQLSKPLKSVAVSYGDGNVYTLNVGNSGETQTIENPLMNSRGRAEQLARSAAYVFKTRKTVSGEYRADPRLDVFDIVAVQSKYGELSPVVITDIKYSFGGSFRGSFTGKVVEYIEEA